MEIAATDPKRAFQMAEDTLKRGSSTSLLVMLQQLRAKDPELAAKLAYADERRLLEKVPDLLAETA